MPRNASLALVVLLCFPLMATAQDIGIPEAPVRYDTDLLSPEFHQDRRAQVVAALPDNAIAIFFSEPARQRANDTNYEYRQSSDLYYLTGTHEPASVLLLTPKGIEVDGEMVQELLFVPHRNPQAETWLGRRFGFERAQEQLGLQKAVSNRRYEEVMRPLLDDNTRMFYHLPLPRGIAENDPLHQQLTLFTESEPPIRVTGNFFMQRALRGMLAVSDESGFSRFKASMGERLKNQTVPDAGLSDAIQAFDVSNTYEEWDSWRTDHLYAKHPNGTALRRILDGLRHYKTDEEIAIMQKAIDITGLAHEEAMRSIEPGMHEYEIEALIEYIFRRNGAEYTGFPSIVGSGENSVILHYETNRRQMEADDMVVIDIGAEYHGYSADITRTLPVNGTFSEEQTIIYNLVLEAQEAGIQAAKVGNAWNAVHAASRTVIMDGLRELGLIQTDEDVRNFFMHGTSHYLGMYVHDVGTYQPFEPGVVLTVEPGIYIRPAENIDPKWWHIGVRIEDDVLVTADGPRVMSDKAPRTIEEIEALMRETGLGNMPLGGGQ